MEVGKIYPCTFAAGNDEFCIGDICEGIDENKRDNILSYSNDVNKSCEGVILNLLDIDKNINLLENNLFTDKIGLTYDFLIYIH